MKRSMAIASMAMATSLAGCGNGDASAERPIEPASGIEATEPAVAPARPAGAAAVAPSARAVATAAGTAVPAFAAVYPGGHVSGPQTVANGPDGPGGIVSFTTDADPDAVVAYYRREAEAAGLSSVMAMNQGEARAYGATAADQPGTSLRVVADPLDDGSTSVQLTWSAGR